MEYRGSDEHDFHFLFGMGVQPEHRELEHGERYDDVRGYPQHQLHACGLGCAWAASRAPSRSCGVSCILARKASAHCSACDAMPSLASGLSAPGVGSLRRRLRGRCRRHAGACAICRGAHTVPFAPGRRMLPLRISWRCSVGWTADASPLDVPPIAVALCNCADSAAAHAATLPRCNPRRIARVWLHLLRRMCGHR